MILGMGLLWILFHYSACTQHSGPRGLSILFQPFIKHSGAAFSNKSTTVGVYFIQDRDIEIQVVDGLDSANKESIPNVTIECSCLIK